MYGQSFHNCCPKGFGKDSGGLGNKPRIETKFNYVKIPHTMAGMMIMKSPTLQPSNADQQQRYTVNL